MVGFVENKEGKRKRWKCGLVVTYRGEVDDVDFPTLVVNQGCMELANVWVVDEDIGAELLTSPPN